VAGADPIRLGLGPVSLSDGSVSSNQLGPGELKVEKKAVWVGTGNQPVRLGIVQAPGKKPMPATDWARGARLTPEARLQ